MNKGIRQVNPPLQHLGTKSQGPIPDALKSPRSFPLYLRVDRGRGKGVDWPRNLRRATPAKRVTLLIRGDAVGGTAAPPPICLGASRGVLDKMGLGKLTSLPSSGKSGPGSSLCLIRGGRGCRAPLHPIPSGQAGRGRGSDSWGRAGLGSLSISPSPANLRRPPHRRRAGAPTCSQRNSGLRGPRAGCRGCAGSGRRSRP